MVLSRREFIIGTVLSSFLLKEDKVVAGEKKERKYSINLQLNFPDNAVINSVYIHSVSGSREITDRLSYNRVITGKLKAGVYAIEINTLKGDYYVRLNVEEDIDKEVNFWAYDKLYKSKDMSVVFHSNTSNEFNMIVRFLEKNREISVLNTCVYYDIFHGLIVSDSQILKFNDRIVNIPALGIIGVGLLGYNPIKVDKERIKLPIIVADKSISNLINKDTERFRVIEEYVSYDYKPYINDSISSDDNIRIKFVERYDLNMIKEKGLKIKRVETLFDDKRMPINVRDLVFTL